MAAPPEGAPHSVGTASLIGPARFQAPWVAARMTRHLATYDPAIVGTPLISLIKAAAELAVDEGQVNLLDRHFHHAKPGPPGLNCKLQGEAVTRFIEVQSA